MRYISRREDSTEGIPIGSIGARELYSPYEKNSRRVQSTKGRGFWNASTRSSVDRLLNRFDRTSPNVVLQTCYRDTKLNKFPENEQFSFENLKPTSFYFISNRGGKKFLKNERISIVEISYF